MSEYVIVSVRTSDGPVPKGDCPAESIYINTIFTDLNHATAIATEMSQRVQAVVKDAKPNYRFVVKQLVDPDVGKVPMTVEELPMLKLGHPK